MNSCLFALWASKHQHGKHLIWKSCKHMFWKGQNVLYNALFMKTLQIAFQMQSAIWIQKAIQLIHLQSMIWISQKKHCQALLAAYNNPWKRNPFSTSLSCHNWANMHGISNFFTPRAAEHPPSTASHENISVRLTGTLRTFFVFNFKFVRGPFCSLIIPTKLLRCASIQQQVGKLVNSLPDA